MTKQSEVIVLDIAPIFSISIFLSISRSILFYDHPNQYWEFFNTFIVFGTHLCTMVFVDSEFFKRSIALSNKSKITLCFMQYYLLLWQVYSKSVYHTQLTIVDSLSSSLFLFKGIIIHHRFILRIYIKL